MTEILSTVLAMLAVTLGLTGLVRYARNDSFAGPGLGHRDYDDLAPSSELHRLA